MSQCSSTSRCRMGLVVVRMAAVTFAPQVPEIGEGGRAVTQVSFGEPGTYALQAVADDTVLVSAAEVTVTVEPATSAP